MQPVVVSLCDRTGNMVRPWASAGYPCVCVDLESPGGTEYASNGGEIEYVRADVFEWELPTDPVRIVFGFPPCTDLAASGARHFAAKGLTRCIDALRLVDRVRVLCEATGAPWLIENPVGRLSTCWRKPDHLFNPCDYGGYLTPPGDAYTKRTCLWTGAGFRMPEPRRVEPVEGSRMHRLPPSQERQFLRSATPQGFAMAVFLANRERLT